MSKQISFEYKGKQYTLEYTRASVRYMEQTMGFNPNDVQDKLMTRLPQLFRGAFMAHHPDVKNKVIDAIYDTMDDKMGLFRCLFQMYNDPYNEMLQSPQGDKGNAVTWTANWSTEDEE
jgi:hypothetical protein